MQLYKLNHEPGTSFKCYFHPSHVLSDGVVLFKSIHWSLAVHVIMWPSLGILMGVSICAYTYYWKKCKRNGYDVDTLQSDLSPDTIAGPYNWERY